MDYRTGLLTFTAFSAFIEINDWLKKTFIVLDHAYGIVPAGIETGPATSASVM